MKMKKVVFHISEQLAVQIEEATKRWGFFNNPEFFRYAAIEFLRNDARFMPADEVLEVHAKAIRGVRACKKIREDRMAWYDRKKEKDADRMADSWR